LKTVCILSSVATKGRREESGVVVKSEHARHGSNIPEDESRVLVVLASYFASHALFDSTVPKGGFDLKAAKH
jgi:hypothetical protein